MQVETNASQVAAELDKIGRNLHASSQVAMPDAAADVYRYTVRGVVARFSRSGRLRESFRKIPTRRGRAAVLSSSPYAAIQDRGGTIRGSFAVRLPGQSGGAGLVPIGASSSDVLARTSGRRVIPAIALVKSVRIPAKNYLDKAWRRARSLMADAALDKAEGAIRG